MEFLRQTDVIQWKDGEYKKNQYNLRKKKTRK